MDHPGQELTVHLDFVPGSRFPVPGAGHQLLCPVHDTVEKRWRHLNFWQYRTTITARVREVRAACRSSGVSSNVRGLTSAKRGVAPARTTPSAEATKVLAGTITSSPGPIPKATSVS